MTPKNRNKRLGLIVAGAVLLAGAAGFLPVALERNISYFYTPSEVKAETLAADARIRLGGLVETGSVRQQDDATTEFRVTDGAETIRVIYTGILPDLFREGQGVIAQGRFNSSGDFETDFILAKHDENYVPKELKEIVENHGAAQ